MTIESIARKLMPLMPQQVQLTILTHDGDRGACLTESSLFNVSKSFWFPVQISIYLDPSHVDIS